MERLKTPLEDGDSPFEPLPSPDLASPGLNLSAPGGLLPYWNPLRKRKHFPIGEAQNQRQNGGVFDQNTSKRRCLNPPREEVLEEEPDLAPPELNRAIGGSKGDTDPGLSLKAQEEEAIYEEFKAYLVFKELRAKKG